MSNNFISLLLNICLACTGVMLLVGMGEVIFKKIKTHPEIARKAIHISTGMFIATFAYWMSYEAIFVTGFIMMLGNLLNRRVKLVKSINDVKRKTKGDVLFALGVMLLAVLEPKASVYMVAMLHVAFCDAVAALAGELLAKDRGVYYIFGNRKSILGTAAFFVSSLTLVTLFAVYTGASVMTALYIVPLVTVLENILSGGYDNALLPFVVALYLSTL